MEGKRPGRPSSAPVGRCQGNAAGADLASPAHNGDRPARGSARSSSAERHCATLGHGRPAARQREFAPGGPGAITSGHTHRTPWPGFTEANGQGDVAAATSPNAGARGECNRTAVATLTAATAQHHCATCGNLGGARADKDRAAHPAGAADINSNPTAVTACSAGGEGDRS